MEEKRQERKEILEDMVFGGKITCSKCGEKFPYHPRYMGCLKEECPLYIKEYYDPRS